MPNLTQVICVGSDEQLWQVLSGVLTTPDYPILITEPANVLQTYPPQNSAIVLLDISQLPEEGLTVLKAIRAHDPDAEIIPLTAPGDMAMVIEALRAGATDVIPKPPDPADLEVVLRHATERLARKHALREAGQKAIESQEHERLENHLRVIYELGWQQTLLHDEPTIIQRALEAAAQVIDFEFGGFGLVDQATNELVLRYFLYNGRLKTADYRLPLDSPHGIAVAVARSGQGLSIADVTLDPRYICYDETLGPFRSELCVPMKIGKRVSGVLNVESTQPYHFTVADRQLLQMLANQTAVVLENARLYAQVQRHAHELALLNEATHALASNLDLNVVLRQTMISINTLLEAEDAAVLLLDAENHDLVFAALASDAAFKLLFSKHIPLDNSVAGWVVQNKQPLLLDHAHEDPRFSVADDTAPAIPIHSLLAVPLMSKDRTIGVIEAINKVNGAFDDHDLELLKGLASAAAIAIDNAHLYHELVDQLHMLRETQSQLIHSEKMAALGRLIASISHEINNPLQSIAGCLTLTKEELEGDMRAAKMKRYLEVAEDEVERIANIVRRVRDFYYPSGQQKVLVDLHQILDNVLALAGKQLQHSDVSTERIWATNLPSVMADPTHLKQVFLNVILNAIDAMPNGGTLTIRTSSTPALVNIEFSDTGIGMAPETQKRLFEPFFTTKPHGAGLGLSISYSIIKAYQGNISVTSDLGKGTTVTISLPAEILGHP